MISMTSILFFIAIFTSLIVIRLVFRLISSLLSNPPQKLVIGIWELFMIGLSISYLITYIFKI